MKFILIVSNIISLIIGSIITFLIIFFYISDDFQKTYIDILKFIVIPFLALTIGFYQWKKVLLHKNFAEKQFETIVELMNTLQKTAFLVNVESSKNGSVSIFKFDRKESSFYDKNQLNLKILFTGMEDNMYMNVIESLRPIINNVFLPLSVSRAFNKLEFSSYSGIKIENMPEEYAYIGKKSDSSEELFYIPNSENVLTLGNLIEAKNEIFNQIEKWLKENSVNQELNTEYNRYNKH